MDRRHARKTLSVSRATVRPPLVEQDGICGVHAKTETKAPSEGNSQAVVDSVPLAVRVGGAAAARRTGLGRGAGRCAARVVGCEPGTGTAAGEGLRFGRCL